MKFENINDIIFKSTEKLKYIYDYNRADVVKNKHYNLNKWINNLLISLEIFLVVDNENDDMLECNL